jgi:hypothetical protein
MALKGSLRDFGLSEILQMIGHQKKSGVLKVEGKESETKILFHEGDIVSTSARPLPEELEWGGLLVGSGLISSAEYKVAEKKSKESLQPLEVTLHNLKVVPEDDIKEFIKLRNLELINNLFLLNEGDYEFESGSVSYVAQLTIPISSEQVLMDGYRIKDEWPQISKVVPTLDIRFAKKPGEFLEGDKLPEDEEKIYQMVGGDRTARDIIFLGRMGKFETCRILKQLIEKDRIQPVEKSEPALSVRLPDRNRLFQVMLYPVFAILVLLLFNGVKINLLHERSSGQRQDLLGQYQIQRIERALAVYNLAFGGYPETLDDLAGKKILEVDELGFPWDEKYFYQKKGDGYLLRGPAGGAKRDSR